MKFYLKNERGAISMVLCQGSTGAGFESCELASPFDHPIENISDEDEVRRAEVVDGYEAGVSKGPHHLRKV